MPRRPAGHLVPPSDAETYKMLEELARVWSPVKPLPIASVIRECVRQTFVRESKLHREKK